jgi:hypothetical protein
MFHAFFFVGEAARVRREHGKVLDYGAASVAIISPQAYSEEYPDSKGKEHAAVLPLDKFLRTFGQPAKLATVLEAKGREVLKSWIAKNGTSSSTHRRSAVSRVYPIFSHEFVTRRGMPQNSQYELWLNTYSFTRANMHADIPRAIALENVRVSDNHTFLLLLLLLNMYLCSRL